MLPSFRRSAGRLFIFIFFFFWGEQRDFSASGQRENPEGCILEKKLYGNIFMFSKTKDAKGFVTKGKFLHQFRKGWDF